MIQSNISSMSRVKAKVDIWLGDTLVKTCTCSDVLQDYKITRVGDNGKFFGFGVPHKVDINFIDLNRVLTVTTANTIEIAVGDGTTFEEPYPTFYVTEISRNEKTNTITVTACDLLYKAATVTLSEVGINPPYSVRQLAEACARVLNLGISIPTLSDGSFDVVHAEGGNFEPEGTETLKEVFTAIAEVTQTIYYIDATNTLTFKRLDKDGDSVFTISKDKYYELDTKTARAITGICSTNELDSLESNTSTVGTTQYVRSNPLWDNHPDRATLIDIAINSIGGLSITQFDCDWAGDYHLEIGDKISLVTEDNNTVDSFVLNDTTEYDGALSEQTEWEYTADDDETAGNPTNLGEKLNQTFAKVDKLEKNITLYVGEVLDSVLEDAVSDVVVDKIEDALQGSDIVKDIEDLKSTTSTHTSKISTLELTTSGIQATVSGVTQSVTDLQTADNQLSGRITSNTEQIGSLKVSMDSINAEVSSSKTEVTNLKTELEGQIETLETTITEEISQINVTTKGISASVSKVEETTTNAVNSLSDSVQVLTNAVNTAVTEDKVSILISQTLADGVDKVVTSEKQYTFDDEGLHVGSSDSSISTLITEDGMEVDRSGQTVLIAGNEGVIAEDLHATTYLIIGDNSRFEDYNGNRTACFWIGG